MIWHLTHLTVIALPVNVLFALLVITWLNLILARMFHKTFLSQQDLLIIYAMLAAGSAFSGHDCLPRLMGLIPYSFRYATPENDWEALFFRYLPRWLVVDDPRAVRDFYEGGANFFMDGYVHRWIRPLLAWSSVVFLLLLIFLCLTVIVRRQWVVNERLSYPIIQIPLEITSPSKAIFKNRLLWIGFALAGGIDIINGLQHFYPMLPEIPVRKYDLANYLTQKPWNAMGSIPLRFQPLLIGLIFLLPLDLSFSCSFFYLFRKAQQVIGSVAGMVSMPGFPFFGEQGAGALFALVVIALWNSRRHLSEVLMSLFRAQKRDEFGDEPISYRAAIVTLTLCLLLLMFFCLKAGMGIFTFFLFIAIYLTIVVGVARMRAELGPPIHAIGYATPQYLMISMFGTRRFRAGNLTLLALLNWLSGSWYAAFRTQPMAHQLEAFKIAERTHIPTRTMFIVLIIASMVGIESSLWLYPYTIYKEGVAAGSEQILAGGVETYNFLASWLSLPRPTDWLATGVLGVSFLFNLGIMLMRARFVWMPLHPAGYVIGIAPGSTDNYWFALFLCTIIKWLLLTHGGIKAYRKAIPFFVGLVLGETLIGCFWALVGIIFRTSVYSWF